MANRRLVPAGEGNYCKICGGSTIFRTRICRWCQEELDAKQEDADFEYHYYERRS